MAQSADCKTCLLHVPLYADNELDAAAATAVLAHARACEKCRAALDEHLALSRALRQNLPRYAAPPALAEKLRASVAALPPRRETPPARFTFPGGFWLPALSAAALACAAFLFLSAPKPDDLLADEVIASHVRSLMEQHMTDVASTDQHTVKPWFAGKVDFSLPVKDFADKGFVLVGGRLDYLQHGAAAALVYRHQKHIINVFVKPAAGEENAAPHSFSSRGYNLVFWRKNGLSFEAVSDLNAKDLSALAQLISSD